MNIDQSFWQSSALGLCRGLIVQGVIAPLDTLKVRVRASPNDVKINSLAKEIYQKEGIRAFYRGLGPELWKTGIKQIWCWPMMTHLPLYLKQFKVGELQEQALSGLAIAKIDALATFWLDKKKQMRLLSSQSYYSIRDAVREGSRGYGALWLKLSILWMTFLVTQKYLRRSEEPLTKVELVKVGVQVAVVVAGVSAPFDFFTSMKFAQNTNFLNFIINGKYYKGGSLYFSSLAVHNIASVFLLDQLEK